MAAKSKSLKDLLVHQQLLCYCTIKGNTVKLRETLVATLQTVAVSSIYELSSHNYCSRTERSVLKHQGETRGYSKNVMNRDNPQPSPKSGCPDKDAVQRLNVSGPLMRLKIESTPAEMWSSRGIISICCYTYKESLKNYLKIMESVLAYSN